MPTRASRDIRGESRCAARISRFGPAEHAGPDDVIGGDWLFPWKHQLAPSQARGFSADRCFFFLSGKMHRTLSGTGEVSFLRHCDGDFFSYKDSIFSLCVWFVFPDCSVSIREGMRINKYGPRLRIFPYG